MSASRQAMALLMLVSAALLLGALAFQYLGGLHPCEMCYWQRYGHLGVLLVAGIGLVAGDRLRGWGWLGVLAMLVAAGLGLYHMGVEQQWWQGITGCAAPVSAGLSAADMLQALTTAPLVRCDQIAWSFLGVSMAGWNMLISAGAAICAGSLLCFARKGRQ